MIFDYTFMVQSGPESHSEKTDEMFYAVAKARWSYKVTEEQIAEAMVEIFGGSKGHLGKKVEDVLSELLSDEAEAELLQNTNAKTLAQAVSLAEEYIRLQNKKITAYELLNYLLGDITYYAGEIEEGLHSYFEEDALYDFKRNG